MVLSLDTILKRLQIDSQVILGMQCIKIAKMGVVNRFPGTAKTRLQSYKGGVMPKSD